MILKNFCSFIFFMSIRSIIPVTKTEKFLVMVIFRGFIFDVLDIKCSKYFGLNPIVFSSFFI